jgi:hypothetical protein
MSACSKQILSTIKVSRQVVALSNFYKSSPPIKTSRVISPLCIDISKPWGFFDGACQGPKKNCGLGFSLHLTPAHFFLGKSNIGSNSNNLVVFSALLLLLKLATVKGVKKCHVYVDSKLCIDWMNNLSQLHHLNLI